jgi:CHAT domain-containing protein
MDALGTLASTYYLLNHQDSALSIYQSAITKLTLTPQSPTTPYPLLAVPILDGKAQAHLARYHQTYLQTDLDTALWCYQTADALVDKARDRLQNEGSKLFFSQKSRPIYERAIRFCLMLHQLTDDQQFLEKAFYFSERNKATLLFQSLQDAGAKLAAGLPDSLLERERNLKADIAFYQNKIFEAEKSPSAEDIARLADWRQILFDREEAYRSLNKALEERYPTYHQLKYDHKVVSVEDIQRKLTGSQMLLEFFEGDSTIYVFAISKQDLKVYEITRDSLFDGQIRQLLTSLQQTQRGLQGLSTFADPAYQLFTKLLKPALREQHIDHLIIIPDGQVSYLPFELLLGTHGDFSSLNDRKADRQYRHLPYLFRETATRYAYSATLLFANPYRPSPRKNEVAAFAPAYSGSWFLAHNQPQAEAIAAMMNGSAFTDNKATKVNFIQTAPDFSVLHLAMHGEPDLYSPLRARLLFAGEDTTEANSLYAYEIYNLQLNAKMAVLAACESGYGKHEQSEGIYSLARAFRFAGCPSVVSSLWKADGQATTELMKAYYAELEQGATKSTALQAAKNHYLETASNAQLHPYYWANFVVIGDDDPIAGSKYMLWLMGGLILIGGVIGYRVMPFVRGQKQ